MARSPRSIETPGRVVEVTSRTLHGRYLMRPSEEANQLILGVVGRAQAKYGVELFAFVFLSNHLHILMRVLGVEQMALFTGFVKGNIARELGVVHQWREKYWGRRYHHCPVKDTEGAQIKRFRYVLSNSCKEGLVRSPLDWPGVTSARALYNGEWELSGRWFDRSAQYRAGAKRGDLAFSSVETVKLTPMPFLADYRTGDQRQFMIDAVRQIEQEASEHRAAHGGRTMGERLIMSQNPHAAPKTFERSPAPHFHTTTRKEYLELLEIRRNLQIAYREAADELRRGERDVAFPPDCFPPGLPYVPPEDT